MIALPPPHFEKNYTEQWSKATPLQRFVFNSVVMLFFVVALFALSLCILSMFEVWP